MTALPTSPKQLSESDNQALQNAVAHHFENPVTAYILDAYFLQGCCHGFVHRHARADESGMFADGHRIMTSLVIGMEREGAYLVVRTLNSRYVVVSLSPTIHGAHRSLQ
ncbi:hypothetical protein Q8W90_28390 [Pseudomonas aeruginosa]|uniref:hypothetical protein n=1 Tax=Pseudomonas aeruginosa TaxID=287 RepID=UPI001A337B73|nr:hypothetical protein [Pseudomonas aeruginosa]MBG7282117.1 hypothetical protein [Pseudomonas aeruginosa]MDI3829431.1 hypothetical protein [Pseudomonas aeruginosa]MDU0686152.1 hypothetical protein [Pseudomonas aeruginosa]HBN9565031.1 hypothetical protein [Pseudomonas aeruginosa]HBO3132161.1 hypothetical protein [Pseudomonas aeruginosa]